MPLEEIFTREVVIDKVDTNIVPINKLRHKHDRQCDESHLSIRDDMMAVEVRDWQDSRKTNATTLADLLALLANKLNHLIHLIEQEKQKRL